MTFYEFSAKSLAQKVWTVVYLSSRTLMFRDRTADVTYCADVTLFLHATWDRLSLTGAFFLRRFLAFYCFKCYLASFVRCETAFSANTNYRKRLGDTWWILSMRLRTHLGHGQYLFLCKAHRRAIEIRANQIVGCWSWIIQACVFVTFQWKFLREPSKNIHEK